MRTFFLVPLLATQRYRYAVSGDADRCFTATLLDHPANTNTTESYQTAGVPATVQGCV